jgi:microcystin-dependent protein
MKKAIQFSVLALASVMSSQAVLACNGDDYIGSICTVSFNWCPEYTVPADGRTLPTNQNQALYSLIGTKYGGDANNFAVPDLRGRSVVGLGQGAGLQQNVIWGQKRGNETVALSVAQLPAHTHAATFNQTGSNPITVNIRKRPTAPYLILG